LKKFLRTRPFLSLACVTIAIGAAWHLSGLKPDDGPLAFGLYAVSYALGLPFITATRILRSVIGNPALAGILSLAIGLAPYLLADWLLRRRRSRSAVSGAR